MKTVDKDHIQKVVDEIRAATVNEDLCIPLYTSHIKQAFYWSGLDKEVREEIANGLRVLERETRWHVKALREIEKIYLESIKK